VLVVSVGVSVSVSECVSVFVLRGFLLFHLALKWIRPANTMGQTFVVTIDGRLGAVSIWILFCNGQPLKWIND